MYIQLCFCRSLHQPQSLLMDIYSGFGELYVFQSVTHGASDGCLYQFTATATAAALVPHPKCVCETMNKCPVHWLVVVVVSSFCLWTFHSSLEQQRRRVEGEWGEHSPLMTLYTRTKVTNSGSPHDSLPSSPVVRLRHDDHFNYLSNQR